MGMRCDHTGFIKELMAIPFSGNATSGMSWDEWDKTTHWHWMGKINNFLENEVFNAVDLGTETWIPGRVASSPEEKVEAVYLRKIDDNHKKLVGVIMNRTWNWFTIGEGGDCDEIVYTDEGEVNEAILPTILHNLEIVGDAQNHLHIPQMEALKTYHIQYIDANTLTVLNEETVNTIDSKLRLENYPMLIPNMPFVFFKAWRDPVGPDNESFSPMIEEEVTASNMQKMKSANLFNQTEQESQTDQTLNVYPIPCNNYIYITSALNEEFLIYDSIGKIVAWHESRHTMVDTSQLKSGLYFIRSSARGVTIPFNVIH